MVLRRYNHSPMRQSVSILEEISLDSILDLRRVFNHCSNEDQLKRNLQQALFIAQVESEVQSFMAVVPVTVKTHCKGLFLFSDYCYNLHWQDLWVVLFINVLQTLVREILSKMILSVLKSQVTNSGSNPSISDVSVNWDELQWVWISALWTVTNDGDTDLTFSWLIHM